MASKNARTNRPGSRSSRTPASARAVRSAKAAQSGRIASRSQAASFSRYSQGSSSSGYRPATQGSQAQSAISQYSRNNPSYSHAAKKKLGRGKKIAIGVVCALLVAVVGCGSAFALYINSINQELNRGTKTQEELDLIGDVLAPTRSFDQPFYMMLIGSDRRDDDESMGARSDTNIAIRVDPTQNQVTMVSIPRDTMIEIDGYGTNKFNAAYNYGGAAGTIQEASQLLDIDISHYAEVNFEELVELVDAVGGVDVEVDERIDDTDADGSTDDPNAERIIIEEGTQHLDGKSALVFARSRAFVDGDFTRTANQRKLISAIVNKVLDLPVAELPGVIQSAAKCVTTDLSVNDIIDLAQQFKGEGDLTMYSAMVPSYTGDVGGISYVFVDETAMMQMMQVVEDGGDPSTITSTGAAASTSSSTSTGTGTSSTGTGSGYYADGSTSSGTSDYYSSEYVDSTYEESY